MLIRIILLSTFSIIISNGCPVDSIGYLNKINKVIMDFSINSDLSNKIYFESCNLVTVGKDIHGRNLQLDSIAVEEFLKMKDHAERDSIKLRVASSFRTFDYQSKIIYKKLKRGLSIEHILKENTLPGYSEHHTGRAVDFIAIDQTSLSVNFEKTETFKWLVNNANQYGFYLSYPKDNKEGIMYEPWHWMYRNE